MNEVIIRFSQCIKIFEAIAFVSGLVFFKKIKYTYLKWFVVYLGIIVCGEITAQVLNIFLLYKAKNLLYDYFIIPLEFLFFHWLYFQSFSKKGKLLILYCSGLYVGSWVVEKFYFLPDTVFMSLSYSIGNVTLLLVLFSYFFQLMKSDSILNFKSDILFWISLGVLVFYLGTFPYFGLRNVLFSQYKEVFKYYTWVTIFLNYIMYTLFAIGFKMHIQRTGNFADVFKPNNQRAI